MDLEQMEASQSNAPISLGEWHCDETLWTAFRKSELLPYKNSLRAANHLAIGSTAGVALLLAIIGLTTLLGYVRWQTSIGIAVGILVIGGVFIFAGLFSGIRRRKREGALNKPTGDVVVALEGFAYNKFQIDWTFGMVYGMNFQRCERRTVRGELGYSFEVLTFETDGMVNTGRGTIHQEWKWNVPVPADKIILADMICDRLNTRRNSDLPK